MITHRTTYRILCISIILGLGSILHADWSSDTRLTNNGEISRTTINNSWCVGVTSTSQVYFVWMDTRDANQDDNWEIYFKYLGEGGMSSDYRFTYNEAESFYPCLAVRETRKHVVWTDQQDGNEEIYYNQIGPFVSIHQRLTNDTLGSRCPCVAAADSHVHVVWSDWQGDNMASIFYRRGAHTGTNWTSATQISVDDTLWAAVFPSVAVSDTNIHVVWIDTRDGHYEIYYDRSCDNGDTWGNDTRISTDDSSPSYFPCIAVSGLYVHVVYIDTVHGGGRAEIYYTRSTNGGSTWGGKFRLSNYDSLSTLPSICVSGSNVHVVWADERDGNKEIYYINSANNGSTWGSATRLTVNDSISYYPSIAVSGSNLYVVWTDTRDGNEEIYYKSYSPEDKVSTSNYERNETVTLEASVKNAAIYLCGNVPLISPLHIKMYDILGRRVINTVKNLDSKDFTMTIGTDILPCGIYFITVSQKNRFCGTARVVLVK